MIRAIPPKEVLELLHQQKSRLLDIRSNTEFQHEHIENADNIDLNKLNNLQFSQEETLVFYCLSGIRTNSNKKLLAQYFADRTVYILEGGMSAWKKAGLSTIVNKKMPMEIMRQVQIVAGSLVVLGIILANSIYPPAIFLSLFVGLGLIIAGISGFCTLARLLAKMPWN